MAGHRTLHLDGLEPRRDPDTEEDSAHQEVYVVIAGAATFTAGGEEIAAPTGRVVFVEDPSLERRAVADEPGTTVLAIGAERGRIFTPSPWETDLLAAGRAGT